MRFTNIRLLCVVVMTMFCFSVLSQDTLHKATGIHVQQSICDSLDVEMIIPTFRGNNQRSYYGNVAPSQLDVIWKFYLGKGKTMISRKIGEKEWEGAGWTGQPLITKEKGRLYVIQGSFDHHLYKLSADSGEIIWAYAFDDVVKGTGTLWKNCSARRPEQAYLVLQGSRLGSENFLDYTYIPSFRAISLLTGEEMWRYNVTLTDSYSRDVDASALVLGDTAYIGLENSLFTLFNPDPDQAEIKHGMLQPKIYKQHRLYFRDDAVKHKNNVVTEASPCLLGDRIYIASGSGHVWGYNMKSGQLDWDFYIGSDIDGTPAVTSDSCLIITIEKQYIKGYGGGLKLDPSHRPENAVRWFFPVGDSSFSSWKGGVIGSPAINDGYISGTAPKLSAWSAIDGYLYVVSHQELMHDTLVLGADSATWYPLPRLVFKYKIGTSISSPVFTSDRLIAASYDGVYLFGYDNENNFTLLDKFIAPFEASPVCHDKRLYLASRNGYLYCFGDI